MYTKIYVNFIDSKMFEFRKNNKIPLHIKIDKLPKHQYVMILQNRLYIEQEIKKQTGISMSDKMKEMIENLIIRLQMNEQKLQIK